MEILNVVLLGAVFYFAFIGIPMIYEMKGKI